ncbi:unnamed protein product [Phaeothamnion confervicola]
MGVHFSLFKQMAKKKAAKRTAKAKKSCIKPSGGRKAVGAILPFASSGKSNSKKGKGPAAKKPQSSRPSLEDEYRALDSRVGKGGAGSSAGGGGGPNRHRVNIVLARPMLVLPAAGPTVSKEEGEGPLYNASGMVDALLHSVRDEALVGRFEEEQWFLFLPPFALRKTIMKQHLHNCIWPSRRAEPKLSDVPPVWSLASFFFTCCGQSLRRLPRLVAAAGFAGLHRR